MKKNGTSLDGITPIADESAEKATGGAGIPTPAYGVCPKCKTRYSESAANAANWECKDCHVKLDKMYKWTDKVL
jgi:hypothetical protein